MQNVTTLHIPSDASSAPRRQPSWLLQKPGELADLTEASVVAVVVDFARICRQPTACEMRSNCTGTGRMPCSQQDSPAIISETTRTCPSIFDSYWLLALIANVTPL